jgi:glycosyltransferase involved in cell wall biosynthesis
MVLAEAQAVGTPVVSSWHAAIPEAVSHGETGILCAERDFAAIAEALATFLGDDEFWMRTSTRAAAWVRENFDISHQAKKLEDIFDESCSQPRVLEANRLKRASLSPEMPVSP